LLNFFGAFLIVFAIYSCIFAQKMNMIQKLIFCLLFLLLMTSLAQAQKLESWLIRNQELIFEEHLIGRNFDYATIAVTIRYRGDLKRTFQLVRQKPIKSPSPQDCMIISVAKDTITVGKGESADLMTYKIKRGLNPKYLRPMYEPLPYWAITEIK
jgi:hypothetical protein